MAKQLTNDQMIKNLVKELSTTAMGNGLLRERLMAICDMTRESIKNQPTAWANGIVSPMLYEDLCDRIEKHCGYND